MKASRIKIVNSQISVYVVLPKEPVREYTQQFIFVDIKPAGKIQKTFHAEHLLDNKIGRIFVRGNADFDTRATHKRYNNMLDPRVNIYSKK